jgi:hypothetical protein
VEQDFADFASQCNLGLEHVLSPWVLSLDADYELSEELTHELSSLAPSPRAAGYQAHFVYRIHGRPLRDSLYPPRIVLYRKDRAFYRNEGHGHRVVLDGDILPLTGIIYHDDRKSLSRWFSSQQRYAQKEVDYLLNAHAGALRTSDRIRLMAWPAPLAVFFYVMFVKGCFWDGWAGWFYVVQRVVAEALIVLELIDRRFSANKPSDTKLNKLL